MKALVRFKSTLLLLFIAAAVASVAAIALAPTEAHAVKATKGAKVYTLSANTTYTSYDVTGDRKADKFYVYSWTSSNSSSPTFAVYINDKRVLAVSGWYYYANIQLLKLKNGKCFLFLSNPSDNGDASVCGVYRYSNGKLKQVIDCKKGFGTSRVGHTGGAVAKVSGNRVYMKFAAMIPMNGQTYGTYLYKYRKGSLKKVSRIGKLQVGYRANASYKALKNISAYKSKACKSKKFTIKTGQMVKFKKVYVKGKTIRYLVKAGGRTGWIKVATSGNSSLLYKFRNPYGYINVLPPFEGLYMAG